MDKNFQMVFLFSNFCNCNKFQYPSDTRNGVSNCYSIKYKSKLMGPIGKIEIWRQDPPVLITEDG